MIQGKVNNTSPFTSRIGEEVMDFEFEKYKCRVLLRLVGTVEGFHWFRFTVKPVIIGSSSRTTIGSPKMGLTEFIGKKRRLPIGS